MPQFNSSRRAQKLSPQMLMGIIVLVVLVLGAIGGLILSRTNSDTRNQAAGGGQCEPGRLLGCGPQVQCGRGLGKYCTEGRVPGGCIPVPEAQCNGVAFYSPQPTPTPSPALCSPGRLIGCGPQVQCQNNFGKYCNEQGRPGSCVPVSPSQCVVTGGGGPTPTPSPIIVTPTPVPTPAQCVPGRMLGCGPQVGCPVNSGATAYGKVCAANGMPSSCLQMSVSQCQGASGGGSTSPTPTPVGNGGKYSGVDPVN